MSNLRKFSLPYLLSAAALGVIVTGCGSTETAASTAAPPQPQASAPDLATTVHPPWQTALHLADAPRLDAPALHPRPNGWLAAWASSDADMTFHVVQGIRADGTPAEPVQLPVIARFPQAHRIIPAAAGGTHLVWLDANPDIITDGLRLWTLRLDENLNSARGAFILSDSATYHYTALPGTDGGLWTFWTSGPRREPTLYARQVDAEGRPLETITLASSVEWPSVTVRPDGTVRIAWIGSPDGGLYLADFISGQVRNRQRVGRVPPLDPAAYVTGFWLASDSVYTYALWAITGRDGASRVWISGAPHDSSIWPEPLPLEVPIDGLLQPVTRVSPVNQPVDARPDQVLLAAEVAEALGVLILDSGQITGWEAAVTLPPPGLIGTPSAAQLADDRLLLSWSQPDTTETAQLMITLRPGLNRP
ncbi:MAG: hypothetical protein ACOCX3_01265 [Chloroflexota bacterium]